MASTSAITPRNAPYPDMISVLASESADRVIYLLSRLCNLNKQVVWCNG